MTSPLGLIICADDPLARAGLAAMLGSLDGVTVVAQESADLLGGDEATLETGAAEAIVWDVGWNGVGESLDAAALGLPVVALVGDEDQATDVWRSGVVGLLWRSTPEEDILTAVMACIAGFMVIAPGLAALVGQPSLPTAEVPGEELTPRETEVLHLVARGLTNKAIGHQLSISEHTVKFHLNSILSKLGAQSRTDAVVRATRLGLISL